MPYARRIIHYSPGPTDLQSVISDRAIAGCWFELHRQGGCGAGELRLQDEFVDRQQIEIGDWIACEFEEGDRWYLGRVESRLAHNPAGVRLRLEGMGVQLGEVFPGGFGSAVVDGVPPHRYAQTDLFANDPDYWDETFDAVSQPQELVSLLLSQYVLPATNITSDPEAIEAAPEPSSIVSLKFRGEESVRSIIKELAIRAHNAAWGVDEHGGFFFLQPVAETIATWRVGRDLASLEETREIDSLYNRVLLTGDYIYDEPVNSEVTARGFYRWRGNYLQTLSRQQFGDRRIRIWVPWIRTSSDSREFVREFFRIYSQPISRFLVEAVNQASLIKPWTGRIRLENADGSEIITAAVETVRVEFDHAPRFRIEIGPEDPRTHWPEPPHDERWEIPGDAAENFGGEEVTFDDPGESFSTGTSSLEESSSSDVSSSSDFYSSSSSESSSEESSSASSVESSESCLVHDTFTDSNGTGLNVHPPDIDSLGFGWGFAQGTVQVRSNKAEAIAPGTSIHAHRTRIDAGEPDVEITAKVTTANTTTDSAVGLIARYFDVDSHWFARVDRFNTDAIRLFERNSGTNITRAETALSVGQNQTFDAMLVAVGTTITFSAGGVSCSYSSATYNQTQGLHGIHSSQGNATIAAGNGCKWDDFCIKAAS